MTMIQVRDWYKLQGRAMIAPRESLRKIEPGDEVAGWWFMSVGDTSRIFDSWK